MLRANRGEWSELYAFFKVLADHCLYVSDETLNQGDERVWVVEALKGDLRGEYSQDGSEIRVSCNEKSRQEGRRTMERRARRLLSAIQTAPKGKGSFPNEEAERFLTSIGCFGIKAPSRDKRDMDLTVEDVRFGGLQTFGFSVKSYLGGAPTLLNASGATRFRYEVSGLTETDVREINAIDGKRKYIERAEQIIKRSTGITFVDVENKIFRRNLELLDDAMPDIVAHLLEAAWFWKKQTVAEACAWVEQKDPRKYGERKDIYGVKVRRLLQAIALGMMPASPWHDKDDATGGYIVIRQDGALVAFYVYNRAKFCDYLFNRTKFEKPSASRTGSMNLFGSDGRTYVDLCLDIRFF